MSSTVLYATVHKLKKSSYTSINGGRQRRKLCCVLSHTRNWHGRRGQDREHPAQPGGGRERLEKTSQRRSSPKAGERGGKWATRPIGVGQRPEASEVIVNVFDLIARAVWSP